MAAEHSHVMDPDNGRCRPAAAVRANSHQDKHRRRAHARFFADYDLLIAPTSPTVAWPATVLGPTHIGGVPVPPRGHAVFTPLINHALAPPSPKTCSPI